MTEGFLLTRVLLRFDTDDKDVYTELSAAAFTPDGSLWVGSDELLGVERLSQVEPFVFGDRQHFSFTDLIQLWDEKDEIDIEGMDFADNYLWVVGSHSSKRKKPKRKKLENDLERLATIKVEFNRFTLARIPVIEGELVKSVSTSDDPSTQLTAANYKSAYSLTSPN